MPGQNLPRNRMSRHLYDIEKIMSTEHATAALTDRELFEHIVEHRQSLTPIKGISYDRHNPAGINILPPKEVMAKWEEDYNEFINHMVIGDKLSFRNLIERLTELQNTIRRINWS